MSRLLMCIHIKVLALIKKGHISFLWFTHTEGTGKSSSMLSKIGAMDIASPLKQEVTGSIPGDSVIF